MGDNKPKVFGIGLQKTGTSSLGRALEILGYNISHNFNLELAHEVMKGNNESIYEEVEKWDAFQDNPWPMVYKQVDSKFPGSKFILTDRDIDSWLRSVIKHYGTKEYPFEKWYYNAKYPVGNEGIYIKKYQDHIKEVKAYFGNDTNRLLIVNWEEGHGWEELCGFLNKDIPTEPFPHWNKNKTFKDKAFKKLRRIKKRMKDLFS